MEKIGDAAEQQKYKNSHLTIQEEDYAQENQQPNTNSKHFLKQTFTYKMSK